MKRARQIEVGLVSVVAMGFVHCASNPPTALREPRPIPEVKVEPVADRVVPSAPAASLVDDPAVTYLPGSGFDPIGGGRRGAVIADVRIVLDERGAHAVDAAKIDDLGSAQTLPASLGGGTLFVGQRTVRFAPTFDGAFVTIAEQPGVEVGVGFRSVLVSKRRDDPTQPSTTTPRLFELPSGKELPLAPPGLVQLFGTPQGLVGAIDDKGALHASKGGAPWKKLTSAKAVSLRYDGRGLVVDTEREPLRLGFEQVLGPLPRGEAGMTVSDNLMAFLDPFPTGASAPPPPEPDVAHLVGPFARRSDGSWAFSVESDELVFRDPSNGKVTKRAPGALGGRKNCFPIRGGTPSFIGCNGDGTTGLSEMVLLRVESPEKPPVVERSFRGIYTQDFGNPALDAPLVVSARCDTSLPPELGTFCVRRDGAFVEAKLPASELPKVARVPHLVHVTASREGNIYGFGWEDGGGDLLVVDLAQSKVRRLAKASFPKAAVGGIRWDGLSVEGGTLRFVLASGGVLEIRPNDAMTLIPLDGKVAAAGARCLQLTPDGRLRESLDAGRTFHEVPPPPGGLPGGKRGAMVRCFETGCEIGPWYRSGWTGQGLSPASAH